MSEGTICQNCQKKIVKAEEEKEEDQQEDSDEKKPEEEEEEETKDDNKNDQGKENIFFFDSPFTGTSKTVFWARENPYYKRSILVLKPGNGNY